MKKQEFKVWFSRSAGVWLGYPIIRVREDVSRTGL